MKKRTKKRIRDQETSHQTGKQKQSSVITKPAKASGLAIIDNLKEVTAWQLVIGLVVKVLLNVDLRFSR